MYPTNLWIDLFLAQNLSKYDGTILDIMKADHKVIIAIILTICAIGLAGYASIH